MTLAPPVKRITRLKQHLLSIRQRVGQRLAARATLRGALANSAWLAADHLLRMTAGLLVGVWMARYLGPEQFGWLGFAAANVGMIAAFATMGVGPVLVRELAREADAGSDWLSAAFSLRFVTHSIGYLACIGIAYAQEAAPPTVILIVAGSLFFQVPEVADSYFQAFRQNRTSALVRMVACLCSNVVKVGLIVAGASVELLAAAGVFEVALGAGGYWWSLRRMQPSLHPWRLVWERVPKLLRESWPLAVSAAAVSIQAYADQLFLGAILGSEQLGLYTAALRLVSIFAFIPMVVQTVAAPEIARAKRDDEATYRRRLYNLYRLMFALSLATGLLLVVVGPLATQLLYGLDYEAAAPLVPWLALRLFFTHFGLARGLFLTNEGLLRFSLLTSVVGAMVNLALNAWFVPLFGVFGAIAASMISFAVTTFALDGFSPRTRLNVLLMWRAMSAPWRSFGTFS